MEILTILIPLSVALMAIAVRVFLWAVNTNQFEQLEKHGFDIFEDESGDTS
jgi:cbb3-type cytochrome oxidase maturation protein